MIEINRNPTAKELRFVGVLIAVFFALIAGIVYWRFGASTVAITLVIIGCALMAIFYAVPVTRRPIYLGWMYAAFPIGWLVSHILLAIVYFLVMTPIGLVMRLIGRDPLNRAFDASRSTYWEERPPAPAAERYFRQF